MKPFWRCGDRVVVGKRVGTVIRPIPVGYVGVLFDGDKAQTTVHYRKLKEHKDG